MVICGGGAAGTVYCVRGSGWEDISWVGLRAAWPGCRDEGYCSFNSVVCLGLDSAGSEASVPASQRRGISLSFPPEQDRDICHDHLVPVPALIKVYLRPYYAQQCWMSLTPAADMYQSSDLLLPSECRTRMPRSQYYSRMVNCPRPDLSYPALGSGVTNLAVSPTQPGRRSGQPRAG